MAKHESFATIKPSSNIFLKAGKLLEDGHLKVVIFASHYFNIIWPNLLITIMGCPGLKTYAFGCSVLLLVLLL